MKVVLLADVKGVAKKGELIIKQKATHGNFLLPRKLCKGSERTGDERAEKRRGLQGI